MGYHIAAGKTKHNTKSAEGMGASTARKVPARAGSSLQGRNCQRGLTSSANPPSPVEHEEGRVGVVVQDVASQRQGAGGAHGLRLLCTPKRTGSWQRQVSMGGEAKV